MSSQNHLSYNSSQMEELLRRAAAARRGSVESSSSMSSSLYFEGWDYDEDFPSSLSTTPSLRSSTIPPDLMPKLVDRDIKRESTDSISNEDEKEYYNENVVDAENPFEMELSYNAANGTGSNHYENEEYAAADAQKSEDPAVQEKLRWRREILESELIYYADLNLLITHFYEPLRHASESDEVLVPKDKIERIFGNILQVIEITEEFIAHLELYSTIPGLKIQPIFAAIVSKYISAYVEYMKKYPISKDCLTDLKKSGAHVDLRNWIKKAENNSMLGQRQLGDFLLLPCHRPQRMISNFEAWKERVPNDFNWDKKDVEVSLVQFKGIVRFIHECQQNAEVDFERQMRLRVEIRKAVLVNHPVEGNFLIYLILLIRGVKPIRAVSKRFEHFVELSEQLHTTYGNSGVKIPKPPKKNLVHNFTSHKVRKSANNIMEFLNTLLLNKPFNTSAHLDQFFSVASEGGAKRFTQFEYAVKEYDLTESELSPKEEKRKSERAQNGHHNSSVVTNVAGSLSPRNLDHHHHNNNVNNSHNGEPRIDKLKKSNSLRNVNGHYTKESDKS